MKIALILLFLSSSLWAKEKPVYGHLDLQVHLTTHLLYPLLVGKKSSLDKVPDKPLSHKHTFKQTAYESQIWESSTSLYVVTALDEYFHPSRKSMIKALHKQLNFIKDFVKKYPHRYALAKTPEEARRIIHSGRKAFVFALEGATRLIKTKVDAKDLADLGVSMVGIIHLRDNEYGSSSIMEGPSKLLNLKGIFSRLFGLRHKGLTVKGRRAMLWLKEAGIITDISHMDKYSIRDALDLAEENYFPVVATHTGLQSVTGDRVDLTDEMAKRIYNLGGLIGITSGNPREVDKDFTGYMPKNYCPKSYQDLGIQSRHLTNILGNKGHSIGFATDMNGLVNHFRPKYGKKGCFHKKAQLGDYFSFERRAFDSFDIRGLNHIGAVKGIWKNLQRDLFDTEVFMNSAERFLQIWEAMRAKRTL